MAFMQKFDQNMRSAVNGTSDVFELPGIIQKLFLMNSGMSPLKDKRKYSAGSC